MARKVTAIRDWSCVVDFYLLGRLSDRRPSSYVNRKHTKIAMTLLLFSLADGSEAIVAQSNASNCPHRWRSRAWSGVPSVQVIVNFGCPIFSMKVSNRGRSIIWRGQKADVIWQNVSFRLIKGDTLFKNHEGFLVSYSNCRSWEVCMFNEALYLDQIACSHANC